MEEEGREKGRKKKQMVGKRRKEGGKFAIFY